MDESTTHKDRPPSTGGGLDPQSMTSADEAEHPPPSGVGAGPRRRASRISERSRFATTLDLSKRATATAFVGAATCAAGGQLRRTGTPTFGGTQ